MEIDRFYFLPDIVANSMYDSEAVLKNYGDNTQENLRAQRGSYKLERWELRPIKIRSHISKLFTSKGIVFGFMWLKITYSLQGKILPSSQFVRLSISGWILSSW